MWRFNFNARGASPYLEINSETPTDLEDHVGPLELRETTEAIHDIVLMTNKGLSHQVSNSLVVPLNDTKELESKLYKAIYKTLASFAKNCQKFVPPP